MSRSLQTAVMAGGVCLVLGYLAVLIFRREPNGYMPEGFYSDTDWLDVEDCQLISIHDGQLLRFKFNSSQVDKVQSAYHNREPIENIVSLKGKGNKLTAIPLDQITRISSSHYEDTYTVEYRTVDEKTGSTDTETATLEFLNPTVKSHAMEALAERLENKTDIARDVKHLTRLQSFLPGFVIFLIGLTGVWYFDMILLIFIFGFMALIGAKSAIARLWNPTVETQLSVNTPSLQALAT